MTWTARTTRTVLTVSTLVALASCAPGEDSAAEEAASVDTSTPALVGSWRLESWTTAPDTPRCTEEEGSPSGQIMYSADGHMSAQLGCAELSVTDVGELSAQDAVGRTIRRHFSYYGRYTVDLEAQTVTHHVMGSVAASNWVGSERVRAFTFEGNDRIALTPLESEGRLVWVRN